MKICPCRHAPAFLSVQPHDVVFPAAAHAALMIERRSRQFCGKGVGAPYFWADVIVAHVRWKCLEQGPVPAFRLALPYALRCPILG